MIKITKITWERTNLILKLNTSLQSNELYIINQNNNTKIKLNSNKDKIKILLYNTPEGEILEAGNWNIIYNNIPLSIDEKVVSELDDSSRIFKYTKNLYAYLVDFNVDDSLVLQINTYFMMENNKPKKRRILIERTSFLLKIKSIIKSKLKHFILNFIYNIGRLFKSKNKISILFLTENADTLNGNLKVLKDFLSKKDDYLINTFCWNVFSDKKNKLHYIKEIFEIAKCDFLFIDNYSPILRHININKNTKIIQLWHAGVGFKSVGGARFGKEGSGNPYNVTHRKYDYAIVDDKKLIEIYEEVFGIAKDKFLASGMPRLDNFFEKKYIKNTIEKLYDENPILKNKKIILFAPTFRGTTHNDAYYDIDKIDFKKLYDFCIKYNFSVLFKLHPFTKNKMDIPVDYQDLFFDYTEDTNINDLIYITDILITDYSSCAYEFSLFDLPIIFYRYDKILYEYTRTIHSSIHFANISDEALNFDELMNYLYKYKNIEKSNKLNLITSKEPRNACETIEKEIILKNIKK